MSTETDVAADASPKILKRVKTADAAPSDGDVAIKGWVRTVRKQKTLAFVEVNDGSSLSGIQCVLPFDSIDEASRAGEL
jgi:asparaginyl-tRNA synthetase